MKILHIISAVTILSISANAYAWRGPFNNNDNRYNNHRYNNNNNQDRWGNNIVGDIMSDMVGNGDVNVEVRFKIRGKGRGNTNNTWDGNNRYRNNWRGRNNYNNYGYAPYGHQRYYGPTYYRQAPGYQQ